MYLHIYLQGTHDVAIILEEIDIASWVQILDKAVYISYSTEFRPIYI